MKYLKQIFHPLQQLYSFLRPLKLSRVAQILAVKTEAERNDECACVLIILIILL